MDLQHRRAFTLIELLVVVAIMGVLIVLLFAALQKVREVANRLTCANNLHQLALAAHTYNDQHGLLPPNYHEDPGRTDGSHNLFYGPIVRLLPFLELDNAYKNFSFLYYDSAFPDPQAQGWPNVSGGMNWSAHTYIRNPFNRPPIQTNGYVGAPDPLSCPNPTGNTGVPGQTWGADGSFQVFACPSQPYLHDQVHQGSVIVDFVQGHPGLDMPKGNPLSAATPECSDTNTDPTTVGCTGDVRTFPPGTYVIGRSDYVAVLGLFTDGSMTGMTLAAAKQYQSLFNYRVNASLARVPDGTSSTLMFSEFCGAYEPQPAPQPGQPQLIGWNTASWTSSGLSAAFGTCPDPNNSYCKYGNDSPVAGAGVALGGWHSGFFNVVFADGSVRLLHTGLDKSILYSLAGYNDGNFVSPLDY